MKTIKLAINVIISIIPICILSFIIREETKIIEKTTDPHSLVGLNFNEAEVVIKEWTKICNDAIFLSTVLGGVIFVLYLN